MLKFVTRTRVLLLATAVAGSVVVMKVNAESSTPEPAAQTNAAPANSPADNPLLAEWAGPHGGMPPFDRVQIALFKPALEAAMAENLAEIDKHRRGQVGAHVREHHRRVWNARAAGSTA